MTTRQEQRDTVILELCSPEALSIITLINARLDVMRSEPETEARQAEVAILHSISMKLFIVTLPMAIREATDEQGRLN